MVFPRLFYPKGKEAVGDGQPPIWKRRPNLPEFTTSWHNFMKNEVVQDFKATVLQVNTN